MSRLPFRIAVNCCSKGERRLHDARGFWLPEYDYIIVFSGAAISGEPNRFTYPSAYKVFQEYLKDEIIGFHPESGRLEFLKNHLDISPNQATMVIVGSNVNVNIAWSVTSSGKQLGTLRKSLQKGETTLESLRQYGENMRYMIAINPTDEGYVAKCPDFPAFDGRGNTPALAKMSLYFQLDRELECYWCKNHQLPMPRTKCDWLEF